VETLVPGVASLTHVTRLETPSESDVRYVDRLGSASGVPYHAGACVVEVQSTFVFVVRGCFVRYICGLCGVLGTCGRSEYFKSHVTYSRL
jgi:hypothetical protein